MKFSVTFIGLTLGFAVSLLAQQSANNNLNENASGQSGVISVSLSADGKQSATDSDGGNLQVQVWDAQSGKLVSGALPHVGTWQLTSYKYATEGKWTDVPQGQRRTKLITENNYSLVAYEVASGKILSVAGGRYTLQGRAYIETIDYAGEGMAEHLGKKQSFTILVEGDKLHQSGQLADGTKVEEIWQRVK